MAFDTPRRVSKLHEDFIVISESRVHESMQDMTLVIHGREAHQSCWLEAAQLVAQRVPDWLNDLSKLGRVAESDEATGIDLFRMQMFGTLNKGRNTSMRC